MKKALFTTLPVALLIVFFSLFLLSIKDPFPAKRKFDISYHAILKDIPNHAERIRVWIPLASSRDGQEILSREITPEPKSVGRDPVYGNEIGYFEFTEPKEIQLKVDYRVKITKEAFYEHANADHPSALYLTPSKLMNGDEMVRQRTAAAIQNRSALWDRAKAIYDNVIHSMSYDKTAPGWGRGDTRRACLLGKGNCTDFHSLFISMAHAAEIPARFKIGLTVPDKGEGRIEGYHCWAEFYEEGKGWKPVDASEAWKHPKRKEAYFGNFDTNKFLISVGRDIRLVPKQLGEPVNIFFYPYVEVDGREWNQVETSFEYKNLK